MRKHWHAWILASTLMVLAGCVTTPKPEPEPIVEWCAKNEPHYFTEAEWDAMSVERQNFWIAHNERGERECGWQAIG